MIPLRATAILLTALSLAACANGNVPRPEGGPPWADTDKNGITLSKGADECKYQAKLGAKSSTGVSNLPDVEADLFDNCMRRRGF